MTADVVSVTEDQPVAVVVKLMEKHRIKRVPVVRGGKVIGLVSRADLLRAFAGALAAVKPVQTSDKAISDSIIAEMNKETWAPTASEIGRASCRERVGQYGEISGGAG